MPGRDPIGIVLTTLLGVVGAVVATYLGQFVGLYHVDERAGFIGAVIGAILVLAVYRSLRRPRA